MKQLSRRSFLRGTGGVVLGLPLLQSMVSRRGRAAGIGGAPRRFIAFFSSQGIIRSQWVPSGTGEAFQLSPILAPLADHKADLLVLSGLNMDVAYLPGGNAHQKGMGATLTGRGLLTAARTPGTPPASRSISAWCRRCRRRRASRRSSSASSCPGPSRPRCA
jgi:hypothetical protein